jgi:hypothetical protein
MHHPSLSLAAPDFSRHVDKTLHLALQIPVRDIAAVLAPLARENAPLGGVGWHRGDWIAEEGQACGFVEPGAFAGAGGEGLVQKGGVDDADYGPVVHYEADGDAVEGGEVGEVYGSCGELSGVRKFNVMGFCVGLSGGDSPSRGSMPGKRLVCELCLSFSFSSVSLDGMPIHLHQVGESSIRYSLDEPLPYDSSPTNLI